MKLFTTLVCAVIVATNVYAQKQIEVKSDIVSATVYLSSVELNRRATVTLPAGNTDVVFTNLPPNLDPRTINVSAEGKLIIQSTQFKQNFMQAADIDVETKKWRDSLDVINKLLMQVKDHKDVLTMEIALMDNNKNTTGANTGLNLQTIQQYHDYYVKIITENKRKWREEEETEKHLNEIKSKLTQQLAVKQTQFAAPDGQIWMQVFAENPLTAKFRITYVSNNAGWTPEYDLRSDNVNSPVTLNYKASLWQTTNEDWKNIKIKLSTGNPTVSNTAPVFSPWSLNYSYAGSINQMTLQPAAITIDKKSAERPTATRDEDYNATTGADYTTVDNNQLAVVFDISIPYTIPSDGKPHQVSIQDYQLPAQYEYYAMPRLDDDVFLTARLVNWEKLNLLPGNASIYFQNAYVGPSYINPNSTTDTLNISLGRDKKIVVKREKVKDFTKSRVMGSTFKQTVAYDITIRNTKSEPVTVNVVDQYPVSGNSEIEVELEDAGGATITKETGKLTWIITLPPNKEQKLRYAFSVKYPEKNRGVNAPKF